MTTVYLAKIDKTRNGYNLKIGSVHTPAISGHGTRKLVL